MTDVSWIIRHLEESPTIRLSSVALHQYYSNNGGSSTITSLVRTVKAIFPHIIKSRCRNPLSHNQEMVFNGLKIKTDEDSPITFSDLKTIHHPKFFTIDVHDTTLRLGMFTDDVVNGVKVMLEIQFHINQTFQLNILGRQVSLEDIGMDNRFDLNQSCVINLLNTLTKITLCRGVACPETTKAVGKAVVEIWSRIGDENSGRQKLRSLSCRRILKVSTLSQTCTDCKVQAEIVKKNSTDQPVVASDDHIYLSTRDHLDMKQLLTQILPNAPGSLAILMQEQYNYFKSNPKQHRWNRKIISICLSMWCRSKKAYEDLKNSKLLALPSLRLLTYYKNSVEQHSGFNKEVFEWMRQEAKAKNLPPSGYQGGILFDEMSIQDDLVLSKSRGKTHLVGFVDLGPESENMHTMTSKSTEKPLATHVLQFVFLGLSGFRFPIAHFPTVQVKTADLHFLFWKAVKFLHLFGFKVCYTSMDGAQANRDFLKMFFNDLSPLESVYSIPNVWFPDDPTITFIMDISHVLKRIRNNISKSCTSDSKSVRHLTKDGCEILWDHWQQAFKWDNDTNPFPVHHKLTHDHFYLTQESKMRNKLAEDVLDKEMLHLMLLFQEFLGVNGHRLQASVDLLTHTSNLVANFRDMRPIVDMNDPRLRQNMEACVWFQNWEKSVVQSTSLRPSEKEKQLMSSQTREDISSSIVGFNELCRKQLVNSSASIIPGRVNSDAIENMFCQQRGLHNGANTNPTYLQYSKTVNAIILGQTTVSRKSNSGGGFSAEPLNFRTNRPLEPNRKKLRL